MMGNFVKDTLRLLKPEWNILACCFRNRKLRNLLLIGIFCISYAQADEMTVSYGLGVRNDSLRWSIATDLIGTPPNILSELTWRKLQGREDHLGFEYIATSGWAGRITLNLAQFDQGGEIQDSDYQFNNRGGEFSRSLSATHGSNAQDLALIIGKQVYTSADEELQITPVIGLASNVIDLHMNEGVQTIPATGPFAGLESSYRAQFSSTLVGMEARWWFAQPFGLDLKWHHQWFTYHADADWNMRADFMHPVSFNQDGDGVDNRWTLGLLARLNKSWTMELAHTIRNGLFRNGRDVLYLANGVQERTLLHDVEWTSVATSLLVNRKF